MNMRSILILIGFLTFPFIQSFTQSTFPTINTEDVSIVRDQWGVPHIFGKTDAATAYGLAWANAEDAFAVMQETLCISRGLMGKIEGKEGAIKDYFVHSLGIDGIVEAQYEEKTGEDFKKYLDGYCQGLNAYAASHKKEWLSKELFPIEPKDVLKAYMVSFSFLTQVHTEVEKVIKGNVNDELIAENIGSNAFALNTTRTKDGKTYLCINPHFMVDGPFSFWEAHIQSEEGLNMTGTLMQGSVAIAMGNNEHLGWGMTFNHFDRVDSYQLKMHPKKKHLYEVDGEWLELEKRPITLKVKTGFVNIPVKKMAYWSIYGPTYESEDGNFYSVRTSAMFSIQSAEQLYRMNKSTNYDEFKTALDIQGIPLFNIVYVDKADNIYYLSNGLYPVKDPKLNWSGAVAGNSSDTLWDEFYPVSDLPHVENPSCGYVFNTNNTPFNATCEEENDDRSRLPAYADSYPGDNNRSRRFMELIQAQEEFTFDEFKSIKFDHQFPESSPFLESLEGLYDLDPAKYPSLSSIITELQSWDKVADLNSSTATIFQLAIHNIFEANNYGVQHFIYGIEADEEVWVRTLEETKDFLLSNYGTINVPLKQFQCFVRGEEAYPSHGYADVLMAGYTKPYKDGKYQMEFADSYIHFVAFGPDGPEQMESLLPFSNNVTADQYEDQLSLYNQHQTKKITLDRVEIEKGAVRIYHPE